jgi:hypothetical protein
MQICPVGATLIHVDNRQLDKGTNSLIPFQLKRALLWQFNVPSNKKTCLDLHLKCLMVLPDFNQIWIFMTDFHRSPKYQMSWKSINWELYWYMWQLDRHDKGKVLHVNRPKNDRVLHFRPQWNFQMYFYCISDHHWHFRHISNHLLSFRMSSAICTTTKIHGYNLDLNNRCVAHDLKQSC